MSDPTKFRFGDGPIADGMRKALAEKPSPDVRPCPGIGVSVEYFDNGDGEESETTYEHCEGCRCAPGVRVTQHQTTKETPMKDRIGRFLELLANEEAKLMTSKTSFGRNELQLALADCKLKALAKYNDELVQASGQATE